MPHAGRSRRSDAPDLHPTWAEVRDARQAAGLTIRDAARTVFATLSAWQRWETDPLGPSAGDARAMPASSWWLFRLRTGQAALADLPAITADE